MSTRCQCKTAKACRCRNQRRDGSRFCSVHQYCPESWDSESICPLPQCQCVTNEGEQCSRHGSNKLNDDSRFCFQHQGCDTLVFPEKKPISYCKYIPKPQKEETEKVEKVEPPLSSPTPIRTIRPQVPPCIVPGSHCADEKQNKEFQDYFTKFISDREVVNWNEYGEQLNNNDFVILTKKCTVSKAVPPPAQCHGTAYLISNKIIQLQDYIKHKTITEDMVWQWFQQGERILQKLFVAKLVMGNIRPNSIMVDVSNPGNPKLKFANLSTLFSNQDEKIPKLTDTLLPAFYRVWLGEDIDSIKLQYNGKYDQNIDILANFNKQNPTTYVNWMRPRLHRLDEYAFFNALATITSDKIILSPDSLLVKEQEQQYNIPEQDLPTEIVG